MLAVLGARLLPQSYQYPNLLEVADRIFGQLRGDKECPFSGVTSSSRVWRKVPESDALSVITPIVTSSDATARHSYCIITCAKGKKCFLIENQQGIFKHS